MQLCFVAACLTQLTFTQMTPEAALQTPSKNEDTSLEVETVLRTLDIHWYNPKYLTRGLIVAYLRRCFQQQYFSASYENENYTHYMHL